MRGPVGAVQNECATRLSDGGAVSFGGGSWTADLGHRPPLRAVEPKDAYACSFRDRNKARTVAVLELPPVDLPELVVKIAIAAHARNKI
jgi:hypothetical protein